MGKKIKWTKRFYRQFMLNLSSHHAIRKKLFFFLLLAFTFFYSAHQMQISFIELLKGVGNMWNLILRMFPPKTSVINEVIRLSLETLQMALVATVISFVISMPLAILAAKNVSPHPFFYHLTRQVLNFLRGVPELIFALLFVTAVGLGPFAGIMALIAHTVGVLGKLFAEYIESSQVGLIEAVETTGASKIQVIFWGILPQVMPDILALTFYRFEVNVRSATVLGFVGAGGIGFYLLTHMRLLNYPVVIVCIMAILIMVTAIDYLGRLKSL